MTPEMRSRLEKFGNKHGVYVTLDESPTKKDTSIIMLQGNRAVVRRFEAAKLDETLEEMLEEIKGGRK